MTTERIGYEYPSDEQFSVLHEMAKGVADQMSLMVSDPDFADASDDVSLGIILETSQLVWGEGSPDDAMPPIATAVEAGFTNKEASAAFAAMMCMWFHSNPLRSAE